MLIKYANINKIKKAKDSKVLYRTHNDLSHYNLLCYLSPLTKICILNQNHTINIITFQQS